MQTRFLFFGLISILMAVSPEVEGQGSTPLTTLHNFSASGSNQINSDGARPYAVLIQGADGNLYGTASGGGAGGSGTVFKITATGTLTTIYSFSARSSNQINSDGAGPSAALLQGDDGNFYGTTSTGGTGGTGTVFKITPTGSLVTLYSFSALDSNFRNTDGAGPRAALIQGMDGYFYGTTSYGSTGGNGTVFKILPSAGLTTLHRFSGLDGAGPTAASLFQISDGNFYGTTARGGPNGLGGGGTIFRMTPAGVLTTVYAFSTPNNNATNSDGAGPETGVIQDGSGNLYGTTRHGGANRAGTIFKFAPSGALTTLYNFNACDDAYPSAGLVRASSGDFYGTTGDYGTNAYGTIFKISPSGVFTVLHNFTNVDGAYPSVGIMQGSDGSFYGSTPDGGTGGTGTVFKLTSRPPLVFIPGIAGSVLNGSDGIQLWPTIFASDIFKLNAHQSTGVTAVDIVRTVKVNTAVGQLTLDNIYAPFVMHLTGEGYTEFPLNNDPTRMTTNFPKTFDVKPSFFAFPYDWRLSNISQLETLHQYIQNIRQLHGGEKVNVVAHSMGGILIRRYILQYGSDDIEHVATVGTPFWGAPVAIYRMLAGGFFGPKPIIGNGLDWLNNDIVIATLPTFVAFHELLPSDTYLANGGSPVTDYDGFALSTADYRAYIDMKASPDTPSLNSQIFHLMLNGASSDAQDNWSRDDASISYLHIYGQQGVNRTTVAVNTIEETHYGWNGTPTPIQKYVEIKGAGDGVVPLLSSRRLDQYLAPNTQTRVITGALPGLFLNQDTGAEHTGMMQNTTVLSMIDSFLSGQTVPAVSAVANEKTAASTMAVATWRVSVTGSGYVALVDGNGNANTKVSDLAITQIPGVDATYGGNQPWVDLTVDGAVDLILKGAASDPPMEIAVTECDASGTPVSSQRYQFKPLGHSWQLHLPTANTSTTANLLVSVDTNGDGIYDTNEQVAPAFSSGTGPVDTTPPTLAMNRATVAGAIVVTLMAHDDMTASPVIRYAINDGVLQTYQNPISFAAGTSSILKAYAQDGLGNTSPLLTTTIAPALPTQQSTFFTGEVPLSNGVYYLSFASGNPFGYYSYLTDPHFIYHFDLGYEYIFDGADGKSGVYFYDFKSKSFFYTSPGFPFPYLYDFSLNTVLYYFPDPSNAGHYNTNGVRYFYRFDTGQIITK